MEALKDWKTTILGVLILLAATVALLTGRCEFAQWEKIAYLIAGALGGGLLSTNTKKGK